jgi:thymidine phosphorylase
MGLDHTAGTIWTLESVIGNTITINVITETGQLTSALARR